MKLTYLLIPIILMHATIINATDLKNCHYYLDLEKERGCWFHKNDVSDYLVKYGYKYCSSFENKLSEWDNPRKSWAIETRNCLQKYIRENEYKYNCVQLEDKAFDSHPNCYKEAGFCKLDGKEKASVIWVALDLDIFLKPGKSFTQALALLRKCMTEQFNPIVSLYYSVATVAKHKTKFKNLAKKILDIESIPNHKFNEYIVFAQYKLLNTDKDKTELASYQKIIANWYVHAITSNKYPVSEFNKKLKDVKKDTIIEILEFKKKISL